MSQAPVCHILFVQRAHVSVNGCARRWAVYYPDALRREQTAVPDSGERARGRREDPHELAVASRAARH